MSITAATLSTCQGDSRQLTSATIGGINYQWKNNNTSISGATASSVYAKVSGTYELYATNANGCTAISNTKTITILPVPTVAINSSSLTICEGQSTILYANGADSYNWNGGPSIANYTVTPTGTTNYSVTGTSLNGCTNASVITISVNATPTVSIMSNTTTICSGDSVYLTANGADSYIWNSGNLNANYTVTPTGTSNYSVTGTLLNGCSNASVITITINATPTVSIGSNTLTLCSGETLSLTANGADLYTWQDNSTNQTYTTSPLSGMSYSVTGESLNGCFNIAMITVTVNTTPTVSISSNTLTLCAGETLSLTANGASTYTWQDNSTNQTYTATPSSSTSYSITGASLNGCSNTAIVNTTVNPIPTVSVSTSNTLICVGENAVLTASTSAINYMWSDGATTMSTTVSPSITTVYTLTVNDGQCSSMASITQSVSLCTGIAGSMKDNDLYIYPNPFNYSFTINWENNSLIKETVINVYNTLGELVHTETTTENKLSIDSRNWKNGTYFVKVNNKVIKMIKQE